MKITKESIGLIVGLVAVVLNPISGSYINDLYNRGFDKQTQMGVGAVVTVVAFGYLLSLTAWNMYQNRSKTNIPKKTAKTKAQAYLEA